jgi:hypothetical protein
MKFLFPIKMISIFLAPSTPEAALYCRVPEEATRRGVAIALAGEPCQIRAATQEQGRA